MQGSYWIWVVGLLVIYGVVLYFLSIRPQKKQEKKMQAMLDALEVGDSIETSGGLILIVEFGGDRHCRIPMRKTAVVSIEKANSTEE